jgi:ABC-type phosphate/phosphonate transport system permease subunit
MPVAIRRAIVLGAAEAGGLGQQSARSDRSELEALDAISDSPVPDGPSGQDKP